MATLTAYVEYDPETKLYVGVVLGLAGAHTQAATLDELQANLREVILRGSTFNDNSPLYFRELPVTFVWLSMRCARFTASPMTVYSRRCT